MILKEKPHLSPQWIDSRAYKIVETLQNKGFTSYLVGGCVRDLLLGIQPKDFDIATNARPNEVKRLIPQSYIIGRRFRLVLVKRDDQQFEVSTFRRDIREEEKQSLEEQPFGDNFWGSPEEDALRRDFSINALFYNPVKDELIDYAQGQKDLEEGSIRMIGDPKDRIIEDPIRTLRAIRLAHKIRFSLESDLRQAIAETAESLASTALPRRREEFLKFLRLREPLLPWLDCYDLGVLKHISPTLEKLLQSDEPRREFVRYMQNYHDYPIDTNQALELFATFTHSVLKSSFLKDVEDPLEIKKILDLPDIKFFMKNELGMFNYEQLMLSDAIQIQNLLTKTEIFSQRGERRRVSVLSHKAFPLALAIAQRDHSLSGEQMLFWQKQYDLLRPQIEQKQQDFLGKRRNKRPRSKRPENKRPENKRPENKRPENKRPENKRPEKKRSSNNLAKTNG